MIFSLHCSFSQFSLIIFSIKDRNDSEATIIIPETQDAAHPTNTSADNTNTPTTSGQDRASSSANDSQNPIDGNKLPIEKL